MHSSHNLCRLCAKSFEPSSLLHIFNDSKAGTGSLDALLRRYLPFPVLVSDSLSHCVCKLCCSHVIRWHRFLTLCIKAQTQLKDMQQKSLKETTQEKLCGIEQVKDASSNLLIVENKSLAAIVNPNSSRAPEQPFLINKPKRRKSNYCIARWCSTSNDLGIPFFRVPKDRNRALQWLAAADRMDLADKDVTYLYRCYLCATHFTKEMFVNESGKSLNRNAVPSVFSKPAYATKIEEALSHSNAYPKELQGVRLKSILPKSMQQSQGMNAHGPLSVPHTQESFPQIIRVVPEEKPLQEVLFVRDSVPTHSNIHIISMSPVKDDASIQILKVEDSKGIDIEPSQVLNAVTNCEPISSEVFKNSVGKEIHRQAEQLSTCVCDYKSETNHENAKEMCINQRLCKVVDIENTQSSVSTSNTLMDFCSDVTMLDLNEKSINMNDKSAVLEMNVQDQHISTDSLALHGLPSEDSIASFSSNPSFNSREDFRPKELASKDNSSPCLSNIVGSQDFLLMHSSSNPIEQACDHGFRQDKNLNNLCGTIIPEPVPGTPVVYERSMITEASVRTIECTSPNHGQIIEGLIDLDQFLDSG